jgi:DNA polymerase-3 subunit epsilon
MKGKNRFWWFVIASLAVTGAVLAVFAAYFWHRRTPAEQETLIRILQSEPGLFTFAVLLVIAAVGFVLDGLLHNYIIPLQRLIEETRLIFTANPAHRIQIDAAQDLNRLARAVNEGADRLEALSSGVESRIQTAMETLEAERNTLAALLAEMPEGVIVCNPDGTILLYNKKARVLFDPPETDSNNDGGIIGLTRSVFSIIDKQRILGALEDILDQLDRGRIEAGAYFLAENPAGHLIRTEVTPVLRRQDLSGFILLLRDITTQIDTECRLDEMLQTIAVDIRSPAAGIRTAVETLRDYPELIDDRKKTLIDIIHEEALRLSAELSDWDAAGARGIYAAWSFTRMEVSEALETVKKKIRDFENIRLRMKEIPDAGVRIDGYAFLAAVLTVLARLRTITGEKEFECRVQTDGLYVTIDFIWSGRPLLPDTLRKWREQPVFFQDDVLPLTLGDVVSRHEAEILAPAFGLQRPYLRWLMPAVTADSPTPSGPGPIRISDRPEFFAFDLFHRPETSRDLHETSLEELAYTVFDTETTGLDPTVDEIISIGAVRIVKSRLIKEEVFDQLVDPKRRLPVESIRIHGIGPEMLSGKPDIQAVLPRFHQFAADTVLVAHNAAFDMRMLEIKETTAGVRFTNPVLDTLLLSAVIHPAQTDHSLETIAARLGVSVVDRHTALGDALTTAGIFLGMIPLLREAGIQTLQEALSASEKTYYARLKY